MIVSRIDISAPRAQSLLEEAELADPEENVPTFTEDQVNAARHEGYEAGQQAGAQEAGDAIETKINDVLSMIGTQMDELFKRQAVDTATTFTDAVNIAVAIARKCFPHLNDTHGFNEIERMVGKVLTEVLEEPRVIIHVNPTLKGPLDARIKTIASASNFEGQMIILEAEDMAPGDCRIAWSSGTAERDMEGTLDKIGQIIEVNLGSVREEISEEVAEEINETDVDIQPTPVSITADPGELGSAITTHIPTTNTGGNRKTASAPTPTLVDNIDALAAEIAAEAEQPPTDSPLSALETANREVEAAAADPTSSLAPPEATVEESSEGASQMPSTGLLKIASEPQKPGDFEDNVDGDQPSGENTARNLPLVSEEEQTAITAAHLPAGPRNVEPDTNDAILDPLSASADAED